MPHDTKKGGVQILNSPHSLKGDRKSSRRVKHRETRFLAASRFGIEVGNECDIDIRSSKQSK